MIFEIIILYKSYKEVIKIGNQGEKKATTTTEGTLGHKNQGCTFLINIFLIMIKSCGDLPKVYLEIFTQTNMTDYFG